MVAARALSLNKTAAAASASHSVGMITFAQVLVIVHLTAYNDSKVGDI